MAFCGQNIDTDTICKEMAKLYLARLVCLLWIGFVFRPPSSPRLSGGTNVPCCGHTPVGDEIPEARVMRSQELNVPVGYSTMTNAKTSL